MYKPKRVLRTPPVAVVLAHPSGQYVRVKMGFNWPAFFLGPIWAYIKHLGWLWVWLALAELPAMLLDVYAEATHQTALAWVVMALNLLTMWVCGKYGSRWQVAILLRKGFRP